MIDSYHTIAQNSEGFYREKGSKFIAICKAAGNAEEAEQVIEAVRKEYHDARHHCYAFRIDEEKEVSKVNDDGEPSHSAGDPILNQIRSSGVTNVVIVVVRYFGGTKLGVPGLINAYKQAAGDALAKAGKQKIIRRHRFVIHYPYDSTSEVQQMIAKLDARIKDQQFAESCSITAEIPVRLARQAREKLRQLADRGLLRYED